MQVIVVGPASSGFLYFAAGKDLGMKVTALTTAKGNLAIPEHMQDKIEHVTLVDSLDVNAFVGAAYRLHKVDPVHGVVAGDELMVEHAAAVADALDLPFISLEHVAGVRNKSRMRKGLHEAGVRAPKFATAASAIELEQAAQQVGFPAVIKPLKMAGSVGVARVNNLVELLAAYEDIVHDEGGWGEDLGTEVLVEEFLEGIEYIVDGYVTLDGTVKILEFCEYQFGPQPHFQVLGYTVYHPEDLAESEAMGAYVEEVVRALHIPVGPFHAEVMLTKDGPVLVEIANRLPGARVPETCEIVTGVSLVKCALAAATNSPMAAATKPQARVAGSYYFVSPHELLGKTYSKLSGWETLINDPAVLDTMIEIQPGQTIPPHIDERSWIAGFRYCAHSIPEATALRKRAIETVRVEA